MAELLSTARLVSEALGRAGVVHRFELYNDAMLIDDLTRLSIVERGGFGYKLEAPSDKNKGHCDRAFALASVLPISLKTAMTMYVPPQAQQQLSGRDPNWGAPVGMPGIYDSPFPDMRTEFPRRR